MKKLFIISILAIVCVNNAYLYAVETCGIPNHDIKTNGITRGYSTLSGNAGSNESDYGLTVGSGQWAVEFKYGTVWGMANCNSTSGASYGEVNKNLQTESSGTYCWCQATGFTASGNSYTSGPQCTTTASSSWAFRRNYSDMDTCAGSCAFACAGGVQGIVSVRGGVFEALAVDPVYLNWYNNGTAISGGSSFCTLGGTFSVPPTPAARTGYVFAGWKLHAGECGIWRLDTSINGSAYGFTRLNGDAGSNESNYGLTTGSGQWATEFSYGTVWGMAKCSSTSGNDGSWTWPESSKSDWLKTPSNSIGKYCWCQATGFSPSGSDYTQGPQCTTAASSLWVSSGAYGSSDLCASSCAFACVDRVRGSAAFRAAVFGSVGQ